MVHKKQNNLTVMVVAGGTGGHIFPGVAVAEEIKRLHPEARIVFAGTERGIESKILPELGWPLVMMKSASIKDRGFAGRMLAWVKMPISVVVAMSVLLAQKPALLIGIGGYAAGPLSVAAWILGVPMTIVEPNSVAGLTNRLIGKFATKVFISFDEAAKWFKPSKTLLTGTPVRKEVIALREKKSEDGKTTILVLGGSQGASSLNRAMSGAAVTLAKSAREICVLHHAGGYGEEEAIRKAYTRAGVEAEVIPFMKDVWECYSKSDLVISRAGAATLAELSVIGRPAILVPYPYAADDHQRINAESLVRAGGALLISDAECTGEKLGNEICRIVNEAGVLDSMGASMRAAGHPDAAEVVARESLKLMH
jgi:UDP-N-acetylglucosamine--N-acetylmuramyl-(pentapeptide) pyrophosphoryl-undecaprenol N-acetylglucosamine transferase